MRRTIKQLENEIKNDFNKFEIFGYAPLYQGTNPNNGTPIKNWQPFIVHLIFNLKLHTQFYAIAAEKLGIEYKFIPEQLLQMQIQFEKPTAYNILPINKVSENIFHPNELTPTRTIFIYTNECSNKEEIASFLFNHKFKVEFRDLAYYQDMKPHFFICHDSRDKKSIAKPLYEELTKRGYKVWYDETSLEIGDSLTEKIEYGIKNCNYGIIILSKNFLSNEKWTKFELQSFKIKQIINNKSVILPIWHHIKAKNLEEHSLWLLDKKAFDSKIGIIPLVDKLAEKSHDNYF